MRFFSLYDMPSGRWQIILLAMCFVLFAAASAAWAETVSPPPVPELSASVEKSPVSVGDLIWLTLKYDLPEGARLPEDPAVRGIEKLNVIEQVVHIGEIKIQFLIDQLESFKIDRIDLTYFDKNGNEQTIETGPIAVTVLSGLGKNPEEAVLMPIQDIIPLSLRWMPYLPWALAGGILLCVIIALIWWHRKHRTSKITATMVDPPHVLAEKEIDQLVARRLFERGDVKTFYFVFSEIIRRYMESIRHFPAAEMTTEEIARYVRTNTCDQRLLPVLGQADLVKFADAVPARDRKAQDIKTARAYIRQTRPATDKIQNGQTDMEMKQ